MANYFLNVPKELLTDIVARVASSSLKDYFNVKLSSKMFKEAAEDSFVYKHMSFDELRVDAWYEDVNEATTAFINRCIDCENPDAFYRKGMAEYFALDNVEIAVRYLAKAGDLGHNGACYVSTLILLGHGKFEELGFKCLRIMKILHEEYNIPTYNNGACYVSTLILLESISIKIPGKTFNQEPTYCDKHNWVDESGDACLSDESCDACLCNEEIDLLFGFMMLP